MACSYCSDHTLFCLISFRVNAPNALKDMKKKTNSGVFTLNNSSRSKSWRIKVKSVHADSASVFVEKNIESGTHFFVIMPSNEYCAVTTELYNWTVALSFSLFEAEFDVDLLQEIHLTSNLSEVMRANFDSSSLDTSETMVRKDRELIFSTPSQKVVPQLAVTMQSPMGKDAEKPTNCGTNEVNDDFSDVASARNGGSSIVRNDYLSERISLLSAQYVSAATAIRDTGAIYSC